MARNSSEINLANGSLILVLSSNSIFLEHESKLQGVNGTEIVNVVTALSQCSYLY